MVYTLTWKGLPTINFTVGKRARKKGALGNPPPSEFFLVSKERETVGGDVFEKGLYLTLGKGEERTDSQVFNQKDLFRALDQWDVPKKDEADISESYEGLVSSNDSFKKYLR